jgi:hypothetical protein
MDSEAGAYAHSLTINPEPAQCAIHREGDYTFPDQARRAHSHTCRVRDRGPEKITRARSRMADGNGFILQFHEH